MESLPNEVQEDILLRLPLGSLRACRSVWRSVNTIVCGGDFKNRYLEQFLTRPMDPTPNSLFQSVYQELNPYGPQHYPFQLVYSVSSPIRGVVCLHSSTKVVLCNPITSNYRLLPETEVQYHRSFFGYDQETNVFKVLLCSTRFESTQHLVFTVDNKGSNWRRVACEHKYTSLTNALCKDGFLYYGAFSPPGKASVVMRFNVRSEEFTIFPLPEEFRIEFTATMVNYNGQVALVNYTATELGKRGWFQICVRNNISGVWKVERVDIPTWGANVGEHGMKFSFVGTIGTGELVFTQTILREEPFIVLYYNADTKEFKEFKIEAGDGGSYHYVRACLNHFDCLFRSTVEEA